uniref:HEPN domain-containing protein n=1 Tax=Candidatus Methanogaster sp. ANME-2c ERB4 TaxID=2759911 RepID=A0A7G9Y953_9EURY|nr:hypothetical protein CBGFFKFA_00003 [Methanosarcinales archaeon ANME-2c ERB4]QNO49664.1 hypothetical protein FBMMOPGC_00011 [Methanosarcinales archaeon ANME-2c ERB4]QNO50103.1 hypothetical protein GDOAKEED_00007 [Methanosarcinales archaeon ANME-2c ERB4]
MQHDRLMELTPDKWRLLVSMKDIAESGLVLAEENLVVAEKLLKTGLSNRTVIRKSYYSMYHAARSAVYVRMRLDVKKHRSLIDKFKKLLIRQSGDETLANQMNAWRMDRMKSDYDPDVEVMEGMCKSAISDAVMILDTCKNLVEEF